MSFAPLKKAMKVWMAACTILVTLGLLAAGGYAAYHYLQPEQPACCAPDIIEQCLQSGATWNADDLRCVQAS